MPDTPDTGTEGQATAQAQQTGTPTDAQVAQTQGGGSGPWAAKLATQFGDEATRTQVDAFLRSEIQPYTTKLEQQLAQSKQATDLWTSLQTEPGAAYLTITEELFGEEAVDAVIELLTGDEDDDELDDPSATPAADSKAQRDPEVEELLEERRLNKQKAAYDDALEAVKANTLNEEGKVKDGEVPIVDQLFHPFVYSAEGDFSTAYEGYKQYYTQFKSQFAPAEEGQAAPVPPNTLGSDTSTQAAPPTETTYTSIDDALDDLFDAVREAPPVMGGV